MQISSWAWLPNGHLSHLFHPLKGTKCTEGFQESLLRLSSSSCFGLPKLNRTHSTSARFQQVSSQGTPENTNKRRLEPLLLSVLLTQTKSLCAVSWALPQMAMEVWATNTFPWAWRDVAWLKLIRCNFEFSSTHTSSGIISPSPVWNSQGHSSSCPAPKHSCNKVRPLFSACPNKPPSPCPAHAQSLQSTPSTIRASKTLLINPEQAHFQFKCPWGTHDWAQIPHLARQIVLPPTLSVNHHLESLSYNLPFHILLAAYNAYIPGPNLYES